MYFLSPVKVFVFDRIYNDKLCIKRLERILDALANSPKLTVFNESNILDVFAELENLWPSINIASRVPVTFTRPLVFTTMEFRSPGFDFMKLQEKCSSDTARRYLKLILGYMTTAIDQHPHMRDRENNCVCWPTYNFGTIAGCSHGCLYCGEGREGKFLTIALNLEEIMEKVVRPIIENNPWNRVFRMILSGADLITFEPEYGLFEIFSETLSYYPGRYGYFHTSSCNVDWLANIKHRDRLIGVWSVSCESVAEKFELGTGRYTDRFDAAKRCQDMGIPVRYKFKPVIPVKNWRQEYASAIEYALKKTQPESIGFCVYMWNTYDSMVSTLPVDVMDPECLEAAKNSAQQMKGKVYGPFPHEIRKKIYQHLIREVRRHSKEVLLYISTETREMWDELKGELGQDPRSYICGCGSLAIPGRKLDANPGLRYSTYHSAPI
ncbi:MAG: radical SAM protein [Candidatus Omnitrophica bacterium]|nr:radical SAM protein [Candidatus Omnitrophota bacterium]